MSHANVSGAERAAMLTHRRQASEHPPSVLVGREEFARMMEIRLSSFNNYSSKGLIGPTSRRIGRHYRWHRAEIEAWLARVGADGRLMDDSTWPAVWTSLQQ